MENVNIRHIVYAILSIMCGIALGYVDEQHREQMKKDVPLYQDRVLPRHQDAFTIVDMPNNQKIERCKSSRQCRKLAEVIVYESRGESFKGKVAVASVVLNRVDSARFPDTIEAVVHQPRQFSYLQDKHLQTKPSGDDWTKAYVVAYNVKNGIIERATDADHYLAPNSLTRLPHWANVYERVDVIGNHHFYSSN